MRYGLPYLGSKNAIAEWVVNNLPKADCLVDLFCGGCAVTHRALLSGKYRRFIINDIDGRLPKLFLEAAHGGHKIADHPEWISREEFHRRKDEDAYIALIWSFGNNGMNYIYGADIEEYKHAYHQAVFNGDLKPFASLGVNLMPSKEKAIYARYTDYKRQLQKLYGANGNGGNKQLECLQSLQSLQCLQSLQSLQRLQSLQSLQRLHGDYAEVKIPDGAVIYCDPPYAGTDCGMYAGFDSERFYSWARRQDNIYISEYSMPDDFVVVAERQKRVLSDAGNMSGYATERLYTNKRTYDRMGDNERRLYQLNFAEQLTLF